MREESKHLNIKQHTREERHNFQLSCQCSLTVAAIPAVVRLPLLQDKLKMSTESFTKK